MAWPMKPAKTIYPAKNRRHGRQGISQNPLNYRKESAGLNSIDARRGFLFTTTRRMEYSKPDEQG